jgi:hypothetical protein
LLTRSRDDNYNGRNRNLSVDVTLWKLLMA